MNERIEKLAEQVDLLGDCTPTKIAGRYVGYINVADIEKFAELIVKEAGALLMSPEFIGRSDLDWSMVLNEHFGVEE